MENIGLAAIGNEPLADFIALSKKADEAGFRSVWWLEDYFLHDGISPLTALALNTKHAKIGIGIISPYVHHPGNIAMTAATLDELSGRRFILGIGAGVRYWMSHNLGLPFDKPLAAIRESIEIVNKLLSGRGVTFKGQVFSCRDAKLGFKPVRRRIPIYVGAMGPRMLKLAGEIADGVLLSAGASINYVSWCIERIKEGARKANKNSGKIDVAVRILSSLDDSEKKAKARIRPLLASMLGLEEFSNEVLNLDGISAQDREPIMSCLRRNRLADAAKFVSDEMVDLFSIATTPNRLHEKLEAYAKAGAKSLLIVPLNPHTGELAIEAVGRSTQSKK